MRSAPGVGRAMKFVCEKCNTKYSIADAKVRRKVLKIRCKNCSSIIVVRDAGGLGESGTDPERAIAPGRALDRAFDGAFAKTGSRPRRISSSASALRMTPAAAIGTSPDLEEEFPAEETRLTTVPDFVEAPAPAPSGDDEWYLAVDGNQFGPMGLAELCSRVKRGETGSEAFVWRDGFDDWLEINEVPELKPFVPRHPPPPPKSRSGLFPVAAIPAPVRPPAPPVPPLPGAGPSLPPSMPMAPPIASRYAPTPASALPAVMPPPEPAVRATLPPATVAPAASTLLEPSGAGLLPVAPAQLPQDPYAPPPPLASPLPAPAPAAPPARSATPLLLKVTAGAGIASVLLGGALVVYFLFLDRPHRDARTTAPSLVPSTEPHAGGNAPSAARPDAGSSQVSIEFQPVEVERGPKPSPVGKRVAPTPKPKGKEPVAAAGGPTLSEKERALMELYKKQGEKGAPPTATPEARGPTRAITEADIAKIQRKNGTMLKACYERALKRDDTLSEVKANVTVSIDDAGRVTSVKVDGIDNVMLVTCLRTSISHWRFDPIGEQSFRFPIIFRGS